MQAEGRAHGELHRDAIHHGLPGLPSCLSGAASAAEALWSVHLPGAPPWMGAAAAGLAPARLYVQVLCQHAVSVRRPRCLFRSPRSAGPALALASTPTVGGLLCNDGNHGRSCRRRMGLHPASAQQQRWVCFSVQVWRSAAAGTRRAGRPNRRVPREGQLAASVGSNQPRDATTRRVAASRTASAVPFRSSSII